MKRIIIASFFAIGFFIITIVLLKTNIATIKDVIIGYTISGLTAASVSIPIEISNYKEEQKSWSEDFFWNGINSYVEDINELLYYARDIYFYNNIFFKDLPKNADWIDYVESYKQIDKIYNERFIGLLNEINFVGMKYRTHISLLSSMLQRINQKNIFGKVRKEYTYSYNLYSIVENINYLIINCHDQLKLVDNITNEDRKICEKIKICRCLVEKLCLDYDANIVDVQFDTLNDEDYNCLKARKDIDEAMSNLVEII